MKKQLTLFSLAIFLFQTYLSAQGQRKETDLTDAEKAYILARFNTEVKYNFIFYNELAFDWDSLCRATLPVLLETKTYDEFSNELQRLCAKLTDGHTRIVSSGISGDDFITPLPIETKRIGNRVFVHRIYSQKLKNEGIVEGVEVLEINGANVLTYADKYIKPFVSSSTPQWLEYVSYAGYELTKGRKSGRIKLKMKSRDGKIFEYETARSESEWDIKDNFEYKKLENNIGYLKIYSFTGKDFTKEFDDIYKTLETTSALIIDLRDNTGGNSSYADYINRHLSETPIRGSQWSSRMYVAAHASWNRPQEWYMQSPSNLAPVSGKERYKNPVLVLTNAGTFSSSENFCAVFRGMNRGKIVGVTTGGSTGNPIGVELGFNVYAQICTKNDLNIDGSRILGVGIKPDIEIAETEEFFTTGRDVVLEKALSILGQ